MTKEFSLFTKQSSVLPEHKKTFEALVTTTVYICMLIGQLKGALHHKCKYKWKLDAEKNSNT